MNFHVYFLSVFTCTTLAYSDSETTERNHQYYTRNRFQTPIRSNNFLNGTEITSNHYAKVENSNTRTDDYATHITETSADNTSRKNMVVEISVFKKLYIAIITPFKRFFAAPKVNQVIRNIGTCAVNGFMEIITYYFPAPLIPLIAAAAGTFIPFEPVIMLREKMPVNSYRRAFKKAVNSFIGTFDKYKIEDNFEDDPYMTMRFNRRFMNLGKDEVKKNEPKHSEISDE